MSDNHNHFGLNVRTVRKYGWRPSLPHPSKTFAEHFPYSKMSMAALPSSVDLRPQCPPVYNQGNLGSCTSHAAAGLAQFLMKKNGKPEYIPSRLAIYYFERVIENTVNEDSGASLSDAMQVLTSIGAGHESLWWYKDDGNAFKYKPSKKYIQDANLHKVSDYYSVNQDANEIKQCLALGYPIIFGFTVYASFESQKVAQTGIMPMPGWFDRILGGHACVIVGFDDASQYFIIRNSWGNWGLNGYFMMPYKFLLNSKYASDFWTGHGIS